MDKEQRAQFTKSLKIATRRRDELSKRRAEIDEELAQQSKVVASLSEILGHGKSGSLDIGITDATSLALSAAMPAAMLPTEIRDELRKMGYDIDSFSNPLASLHQVLKRLIKKGSVEEVPGTNFADGKKRYCHRTVGKRIFDLLKQD